MGIDGSFTLRLRGRVGYRWQQTICLVWLDIDMYSPYFHMVLMHYIIILTVWIMADKSWCCRRHVQKAMNVKIITMQKLKIM